MARMLACRVAWKDPAGQWNVFLDVCPHRLVPLSEGRVNEDGRLVSSRALVSATVADFDIFVPNSTHIRGA